jgi:hypothetical protein
MGERSPWRDRTFLCKGHDAFVTWTCWNCLGDPASRGAFWPWQLYSKRKNIQDGSRRLEADQVNVCILKRLKNLWKTFEQWLDSLLYKAATSHCQSLASKLDLTLLNHWKCHAVNESPEALFVRDFSGTNGADSHPHWATHRTWCEFKSCYLDSTWRPPHNCLSGRLLVWNFDAFMKICLAESLQALQAIENNSTLLFLVAYITNRNYSTCAM